MVPSFQYPGVGGYQALGVPQINPFMGAVAQPMTVGLAPQQLAFMAQPNPCISGAVFGGAGLPPPVALPAVEGGTSVVSAMPAGMPSPVPLQVVENGARLLSAGPVALPSLVALPVVENEGSASLAGLPPPVSLPVVETQASAVSASPVALPPPAASPVVENGVSAAGVPPAG